jgi:isopropylmalate/homocitrate/citramalate synthase
VPITPHPLIYDWNHDAAGPRPIAMLDDETLRDGLQSPSVRVPGIDAKIDILARMDALGIDTADIGLPGAGPKVAEDVERLARAIADGRLSIRANCAARTMVADIKPIVEIAQRTGVPLEVGAFIGSSPIRQFAEGWTLDYLQKVTEEALTFAVNEGLSVMYVTEDTTRADPDSLRRLFTTAIRSGASRLCIADTVGHSTPNGARAVVRFVKGIIEELGADVGID